MGYSTQVILTDAEKIKAIYGSKKLDYLNSLRYDEYEEYIMFLENRFDVSTGELSLKKLLENILNGDTSSQYSYLILQGQEKWARSALGTVYGYLFMDICYNFGKQLNRNDDNWPMLPAHLDEIVTEYKAFFPIPFSDDWPHIFCVERHELGQYEKVFRDTILDRYPDEEDLIKDVDFIFGEARKSNMDLCFVNY
ncbi:MULTISPECIES: hypothetical protein [unclassified Chryseobacterium]|uniref:DUF7691 family protein n=1 Tax=unclassified Chryseobacterium TaxID=2593645 RepID=UPI000D3B95CB|nr:MULTISPECIES: hypothetical protein [unclassified Chryseobacterium]PTT74259.1 hypothetical protein DBR25_11165 [Chryseobacterium sp. HMWF001]PVV50475.1 hypothetical protein DD829_22155 [Chryseobacterium sp. HMWF035]